jgi:hypothetical protein
VALNTISPSSAASIHAATVADSGKSSAATCPSLS